MGKLGSLGVVAVWLWAQVAGAAGSVVFSAPRPMRAAVKAAIEAQHFEAIDASDVDDALFAHPKGAKNQLALAEFQHKLPRSLPAEVQAEYALGVEACRARFRANLSPYDCAEELVEVLWQRHLERLKAELVLEIRPGEWSTFGLDCAVYRPADARVRVLTVSSRQSAEEVAKAVVGGLTSPQPGWMMGVRPNSSTLPTAKPGPMPTMNDGVLLHLSPMPLPAKCGSLPPVALSPAGAPLARNIVELWESSAGDKLDPKAPPLTCRLSLESDVPGRRPSVVAMHCGSSMVDRRLYAGSDFTTPTAQEDLTRTFVGMQLAMTCH